MNRYYIMKENMDCIEDMTHEFKAHTNLRQEDIQPICYENSKPTRKRISTVLNAFLNTGCGGTVYIGVLDSGVIQGMQFTQYRKDHFAVALTDVMESYDPPVEKHRYSLTFVPIVSPDMSSKDIQNIVNFDSSIDTDVKMRQKEHKLRSCKFCWCDTEQIVSFNRGIIPLNYVVEICIKPWDHLDERNVNGLLPPYNVQPIHLDENGEIYIRRTSGVKKLMRKDLPNISKSITVTHFKQEIEELKEKLKILQTK